VCIVYATLGPSLWLRLLLGWTGVAFLGIGLAYAGFGPKMLLKRADGTLSPLSHVIYAPYHLLSEVSYRLVRRGRAFQPFTEIAPGLLLGCRLRPADASVIRSSEVSAVLDLTSEFSEPACFRRNGAYRCLPVLDTCAPTRGQLSEAVGWMAAQQEAGQTVYVHCALGRGRSALVVMAYLLQAGIAASPEEATAWVKSRRQDVRLSRDQAARLHEFAEAVRAGNRVIR
jgi:diacylglycerol kinase (ATP)